MSDRITLTGLAPAGLLADLHAIGRYGPFHADPHRFGCVVDREGHTVTPIPAPDAGPALRRKLAELLAASLTQLEAESRRVADGFDPDHLSAVQAESQHFRAQTRRDAAE